MQSLDTLATDSEAAYDTYSSNNVFWHTLLTTPHLTVPQLPEQVDRLVSTALASGQCVNTVTIVLSALDRCGVVRDLTTLSLPQLRALTLRHVPVLDVGNDALVFDLTHVPPQMPQLQRLVIQHASRYLFPPRSHAGFAHLLHLELCLDRVTASMADIAAVCPALVYLSLTADQSAVVTSVAAAARMLPSLRHLVLAADGEDVGDCLSVDDHVLGTFSHLATLRMHNVAFLGNVTDPDALSTPLAKSCIPSERLEISQCPAVALVPTLLSVSVHHPCISAGLLMHLQSAASLRSHARAMNAVELADVTVEHDAAAALLSLPALQVLRVLRSVWLFTDHSGVYSASIRVFALSASVWHIGPVDDTQMMICYAPRLPGLRRYDFALFPRSGLDTVPPQRRPCFPAWLVPTPERVVNIAVPTGAPYCVIPYRAALPAHLAMIDSVAAVSPSPLSAALLQPDVNDSDGDVNTPEPSSLLALAAGVCLPRVLRRDISLTSLPGSVVARFADRCDCCGKWYTRDRPCKVRDVVIVAGPRVSLRWRPQCLRDFPAQGVAMHALRAVSPGYADLAHALAE